MPCHDPRDDEDREYKRQQLDRVTRYLCAVLRHLEVHGAMTADRLIADAERRADGVADGEIRNWWAGHKAADARRLTHPPLP